MPRKPRSDSKLKTLPEDVQERIASWCAQDGLQSACSRCASELQPPVQTNPQSLSEFFHWWELRQTFTKAEQEAETVTEFLRTEFSEATPEKLAAANQLVFTMRAANSGDVKTFKELEYLRVAKESARAELEIAKAKLEQGERKIAQKDQELTMLREKFARETCELFLKWSSDAKAKAIAESNTTHSEKIAALRQTYFADIDALEKSGKVQLPE